jgi:hypothetical protein
MKNLLVLLLAAGLSCHHPARAADPAKVAGKWQLALATPHGALSGMLDLKQDGWDRSRSTGRLTPPKSRSPWNCTAMRSS